MDTAIKKIRKDGRALNQLRQVFFKKNIYHFAPGSVLFAMGNTKILCAVSIQNGVPSFLRGKGNGWLTAEYALLPMSTLVRTQRESTLARKDGRSVEIARFIGRCFRSVVDLSLLGEKTITIDCDVLQADGGTRTASITGAFFALLMAQERWLENGVLQRPFIKERMAAVSVGIVSGNVMLDLSCEEDNIASADFNFVITESNKIIEMQGGAETSPLSWQEFDTVRSTACAGIESLFAFYDQALKNKQDQKKIDSSDNKESFGKQSDDRLPFFSLKNRQNLSQ